MATEELTQKEVADRLGLTTRTVRRLKDLEEFPLIVPEKGHPRYPWPEWRDAYLDYKRRQLEEEVRPDTEGRGPAYRKKEADAYLAELRAAEEEGSLIPLEVHEELLAIYLDRIRSILLNIPGSWAPELVDLESRAKVNKRLRPLLEELLEDLQAIGDDLEDELLDY